MAHAITCADCGTPRSARNKNTTYCHACRLLRNVEFFRRTVRHRDCVDCGTRYAPVERGDERCGACELGYSTMVGECKVCQNEDRYLVRPGVTVCKECARRPEARIFLIKALQRGQQDRRVKNGLPPRGQRSDAPKPAAPPERKLKFVNGFMIALKKIHLSPPDENNFDYIARLEADGIVTVDDEGTITHKEAP